MVDLGNMTVDQLIEHLVNGFDALSSEYRILHDRHRELENKLAWAQDQVRDLLNQFTPTNSERNFRAFAQSLEKVKGYGGGGTLDWLDALAHSKDSDRRTTANTVRQAERARDQLKLTCSSHSSSKEMAEVRVWNGCTGDRASDRMSKLEGLRQAASATGLERDFTTPGTPGKLACPFRAPVRSPSITSARAGTGTPSHSQSRVFPHAIQLKRSSFNDPIKAEICGMEPPQSPNPSLSGSAAAACPIRFMNDHSPEEMAKYFETHKHELPRSHEVCIKSNTMNIRQLDAKYGSLVNMIKGLGQKHQPMLKETPADDIIAMLPEAGRDRAVADWAKAVSTSAYVGGEGGPGADDLPDGHDRKPHFDRPVKEIRVGESPSRPWGITVPAAYNEPSGDGVAIASPAQDIPSVPLHSVETEPSKCPLDHGQPRDCPPPASKMRAKLEAERKQRTAEPNAETVPKYQPSTIHMMNMASSEQATPQHRRMVFTGPVFIGYSVEQARAILL